MAKLGLTVVALLATAALVGGVSAASGNQPPLAEAGLDQTVANGTTVYLDAGGSVDPDGTVAAVQWTVTDPDGTPVATADDTAVRTSFTPDRTGVYTVNLSVTDDEGATADDTLYVTVEEPNGPAVTLLGPGQTPQGVRTEFTISATAGDANLSRLHWLENGSNERTVDLSGDESNVTLNRSFSGTGPVQVKATVMDARGYSGTSSLELQVISPSSGGTFDRCPNGGSPYFNADGEFVGCNDGGADMILEDQVVGANGESGLSLYASAAGEVVQMMSESQVDELVGGKDRAVTREEVSQVYDGILREDENDNFIGNIPSAGMDYGNEPSGSTSGNTASSRNSGESTAPSPPTDSVAPSPSTNSGVGL